MSDALPLVDCEPYRARLTEQACADRYRGANSKWTAGEKFPASIRQSKCKKCPIGQERATRKFAGAYKSPKKAVTKTLVIIDQPEPAHVPAEQEREMFQKKKCAECPKIFQPTGSRSTLCDDCREKASGGGSKSETTPRIARKQIAARPSVPLLAPAPKPPLTIYLEKQAAIEEMKAQHLVELAAMIEELERFEAANPSVVEQATKILERITRAA